MSVGWRKSHRGVSTGLSGDEAQAGGTVILFEDYKDGMPRGEK